MRAPFQVLVLPFRRIADTFRYALLARADDGRWQGIAGGGEDDESPLQAAVREAGEEAGIAPSARFIELQTVCSIPVHGFRARAGWGAHRFVIPEHAFGVEMADEALTLSREHTRYRWVAYAAACVLAAYDSNRTALWELHQRNLGHGPADAAGDTGFHSGT